MQSIHVILYLGPSDLLIHPFVLVVTCNPKVSHYRLPSGASVPLLMLLRVRDLPLNVTAVELLSSTPSFFISSLCMTSSLMRSSPSTFPPYPSRAVSNFPCTDFPLVELLWKIWEWIGLWMPVRWEAPLPPTSQGELPSAYFDSSWSVDMEMICKSFPVFCHDALCPWHPCRCVHIFSVSVTAWTLVYVLSSGQTV
jgi:hypothetical protein